MSAVEVGGRVVGEGAGELGHPSASCCTQSILEQISFYSRMFYVFLKMEI